MKPKILFICVENSCRSQMAEAFAKKYGEGQLEAWSAGSKPADKVNETAVSVMRERGIDVFVNRPKAIDGLPQVDWDYVVTMGCGDACPFVPSRRRIDWNIPDPKNLPVEEFRKVRDRIEKEVVRLIRRAISIGSSISLEQ